MLPSRLEPMTLELEPAPKRPPRAQRGPILLGVAAIFLVLGSLGVWGATAPIASAIVAPGEIVVSTKRKQIQHFGGGTVARIRVRDGDTVQAGDVLIDLDPIKAQSQFAQACGAFFAALAAHSRLIAERDGLPNIVFAKELLEPLLPKSDVLPILAAQLRLFKTRALEHAGQLDLLRQRKKQLGDEIEGLQAEKAAAVKQMALATTELETLKVLMSKGHTTRIRLVALEREKAQLEGSHGRLIAQISRVGKEINAIDIQIIQLRSQRDKEIAEELRNVEQQVLDARERLIAARDEVGRLNIRTPVSGTVVASKVHTVGGVIQAGETLLEIVPAEDDLLIEAKVRPMDIDNVAIGQASEIRLSAFKQRLMPMLFGRVTYVSADRTSDTRTGEAYYVAQIALAPQSLAQLGTHLLVPGMPAEVLIKTGERTALAYLMQPVRDSIHRAWREN